MRMLNGPLGEKTKNTGGEGSLLKRWANAGAREDFRGRNRKRFSQNLER